MLVALFVVLHVLMLVYWLGGDLGAFYISPALADPKRPLAARLLALKTLGDVDMAPRTCLILAFPTGFTLAVAKGWLMLPVWTVVAAWVASLAWLALAWSIHLRHSKPGGPSRRLDIAIRWIVLAGLSAAGGWIVVNKAAPLFIGLKLLILAACILLGLLVRMVLAPLGPAIVVLTSPTGPTPESDAAIKAVMAKARPLVMSLWALLVVAALLGAATPV
jgi:hypothetical protein